MEQMKFFVSNEIYNDRIAICKSCKYYFKLTGNCKRCGCFMKIKARLATLSCPEKYWLKTSSIETPDDLPQQLIDEVLEIWPDLKSGRAKNIDIKRKMIELYNTIHNTSYNPNTNCGSCAAACFDGIKRLYKKYK